MLPLRLTQAVSSWPRAVMATAAFAPQFAERAVDGRFNYLADDGSIAAAVARRRCGSKLLISLRPTLRARGNSRTSAASLAALISNTRDN
jgi:hypothetical protein